jgi:pyruvate kinase
MTQPAWKRTKIVATLGPSSMSKDVLIELMQNGMDVCRLNASHGTHANHQQMIDLIREINHEFDTQLAILLDLQGPKIRIGELSAPYPISQGDIVELCNSIKQQDGNRLPMELDTLAQDVKPGDVVLVEDGKVELRALTTNGKDTVRLVVVHGTEIGSRKGVNLPQSSVSLPSITDKDMRDLLLGIRNGVDWIALSFVRSDDDVHLLRRILQDANCDARIISKIEKPEALVNINSIIAASDAVMVARGDLGVEIPIEEVPFWQKKIVRLCNMAAKPVIVATQMLDSMIENNRPTRAEATDVANAVLDGADAVMLSGETSVGKFPIESVRIMRQIIQKAEDDDSIYNKNYQTDEKSPTFQSDVTCMMACRFASELKAHALVGMTRSGYTCYMLSKHRPKAPIFIFSDNRRLLSLLSLVWGVRAFYYDSYEGTNQTIRDVINILKERKLIEQGEIVINTASIPLEERKRTNMIKFTVVE